MAPIPERPVPASGLLPLLTEAELLSDLAILKSKPSLLDAFLPANLAYSATNKILHPNSANLDNYSPNLATEDESVALSYAFSAQAEDVLKIKGTLHARGSAVGEPKETSEDVQERLEAIGREAETLNRKLEAALDRR